MNDDARERAHRYPYYEVKIAHAFRERGRRRSTPFKRPRPIRGSRGSSRRAGRSTTAMPRDDGDAARRADARDARARATRTRTRAATTRGGVADDDDDARRSDAARRRRRDDEADDEADAATMTREVETTRAREGASGRRRARERGRETGRRRRLGAAAGGDVRVGGDGRARRRGRVDGAHEGGREEWFRVVERV